jgi:hypothetical protein
MGAGARPTGSTRWRTSVGSRFTAGCHGSGATPPALGVPSKARPTAPPHLQPLTKHVSVLRPAFRYLSTDTSPEALHAEGFAPEVGIGDHLKTRDLVPTETPNVRHASVQRGARLGPLATVATERDDDVAAVDELLRID